MRPRWHQITRSSRGVNTKETRRDGEFPEWLHEYTVFVRASVKSFAYRAREFPNISLDSRAGAARMLVIYRMLVFQGKC